MDDVDHLPTTKIFHHLVELDLSIPRRTDDHRQEQDLSTSDVHARVFARITTLNVPMQLGRTRSAPSSMPLSACRGTEVN